MEGQPAAETVALPANPARTRFIKMLARYYGALDVGVTELRPYHVYSHIGRGSGVYGAPLEVEHTFAIAFTVPMDFEMVACSPQAPIVMESARGGMRWQIDAEACFRYWTTVGADCGRCMAVCPVPGRFVLPEKKPGRHQPTEWLRT
ncbi:MAG: hypothetical protein Fur0043_05180 [Anaerolineales bacterium]